MTKNLPQAQKPSVKSLLANINYKKRFEEVLNEKANGFMASLSQLTNSSKQLSKCDPHSVIASAFTAACLDLPIDKNLGFAHIVPYAEVAQFQMGWKGFVQLALRSGQYSAMNAVAVNEDAFISFNPLTGSLELDNAKIDPFASNIVGYAFYFKLVSGFEKIEYWTKELVEAHAQRYSQAYKKKRKDSPWFTNFNAMAKKTVVKNTLSQWGILSIDMQKAVDFDQSSQRTLDSDVIYPDNTDLIDVESIGYEPLSDEEKKEIEKTESVESE